MNPDNTPVSPILPGAWLGMVGGGQLGRMFCFAAQAMGYRVAVLDPDEASPAGAALAKRGITKHAPARVVASAPRYLGLSKKLISDVLAESSGAMSLMLASNETPGPGLACVSATISAIVRPRVLGKNSGIRPVSSVRAPPIRIAHRRQTGKIASGRMAA